jgi:hypothetical protein
MKTIKEQIAYHRGQIDGATEIIGILETLPSDIMPPSVSNVYAQDATTPRAWLSWSGPAYDPDYTYNPVDILRRLESLGWSIIPSTLVRWDDYQPSPEMGLETDIPAVKGRYKQSDLWAIVPMWMEVNRHTAPDVCFFLQSPDGVSYKVSMDIPRIVFVVARRKDYRGGWKWESGSGRVEYPGHWEIISIDSTEMARIAHTHSRARLLGEQDLSARVFWESHGPQDEWDIPASNLLSYLLTVLTK